MSDPANNDLNSNRMSVYQQLCSSYQEIDAFRAELLERLPLATGAGGILLLYVTGNAALPTATIKVLPGIGLFGFVIRAGYSLTKFTESQNATH